MPALSAVRFDPLRRLGPGAAALLVFSLLLLPLACRLEGSSSGDETAGQSEATERAAGAEDQGRSGKSDGGRSSEGRSESRRKAAEKKRSGAGTGDLAARETAADERPAAGTESGARKRGKRKAQEKESDIPPPALTHVAPAEELSTEQIAAEVALLRKEREKLQAGVTRLVPDEPYILINTTLNRLSLKRGDEYLVRDAVVSTGSNTELIELNGTRRWFFSTPKGVHVVKRKMVAPIWVKPDWAFIEEGEPVPGAQAEARFEEGTLGKYALYFGNGYMIHGTLFQRFLGQSVTHGCVRVGDADLETVYQNAKVGTKIYIY